MSTKQKGQIAESHKDDGDVDHELDEYGEYAVEVSKQMTFAIEKMNLAANDPSRWCFDSGATSMSTGCQDIFESLDKQCHGTLTITSGV